jgi:hypothetical protein
MVLLASPGGLKVPLVMSATVACLAARVKVLRRALRWVGLTARRAAGGGATNGWSAATSGQRTGWLDWRGSSSARRSSIRRIFPVSVFGRPSTNSISRG